MCNKGVTGVSGNAHKLLKPRKIRFDKKHKK